MDHKTYRSKPLVVAVLLLFVVILSRESFTQTGNQAQNDFTKAFQAGKKLYEDGEHKEAALKFFQALTSAKEKSEIVEACFYLSLSYYGLGDNENTQLYMKRMFEAQPEREIDARLFPAGYVILFYRMKGDLAKPQPAKIEDKPKKEAKAEEKKVEPEKKAKEEEKKPVAVGGKAETAPQVKKKGKFPWLIVGGLVVVTGVVLYLLLNKKKGSEQGSISVASTPAGAKVFLDGTDTGLTTSCTLSSVSPGVHVVKLVKDGYADFEQNVTVTAGQTATVNAVLTRNTIIITSPAAGMIWIKGFSNDIRWQVGSGLSEEKRVAGPGPPGSAVLAPRRTRVKKGTSFPSDPNLRERGREDRPEAQSRTEGVLGITKVKIELYKGGALVSVIIAETDNDGSYSWQTPDITSGGSDYKMRVSCSTDSSIYGESGMFTIAPGFVTVNEPLSGSAWSQGSTHDIKWTSTAFGNVNIELYKGGSFVQSIVADTLNDGIHTWTIPTGLTNGSDYRIRISTVFSPGLFGESALFTIGSSGYEFVIKWGSEGIGDGQFNNPQGVTVDASGYVYVADTNNHRIQKFMGSSVFVSKWGEYGSGNGQFKTPWGMTVDNAGFIYVVEADNDRVQKFDSNLAYLAQWGSRGTGDGQFNTPQGIAVDGSGNVYVADTANVRIQKFNSNGVFLAKWGSGGTGDGQFNAPKGIAVDGAGSFFVLDSHNDRVQKFNSNGAYLTQWGSRGTGDGQFNLPEGIAVDGSGNVYVTEYTIDRVQKFRPKAGASPLSDVPFRSILAPLLKRRAGPTPR